MKKILFLIGLSYYCYAGCVYVNCAPSVTLATTITGLNLESIFGKINSKLIEVKNVTDDYNDAIKKNNELYDKNIKLKIEYLLTLQEIKQKQELLKNKGVINEK